MLSLGAAVYWMCPVRYWWSDAEPFPGISPMPHIQQLQDNLIPLQLEHSLFQLIPFPLNGERTNILQFCIHSLDTQGVLIPNPGGKSDPDFGNLRCHYYYFLRSRPVDPAVVLVSVSMLKRIVTMMPWWQDDGMTRWQDIPRIYLHNSLLLSWNSKVSTATCLGKIDRIHPEVILSILSPVPPPRLIWSKQFSCRHENNWSGTSDNWFI